VSFFYEWRPYVSVTERRREAERKLATMRKKGQPVAPVILAGNKIATSFWGVAWCTNLERYSDYASRLPRGRNYVRNGCVLDLQVAKGEVVALVSGTDLYKIKVTITPVAAERWKAICRDCAGTIDSVVELLQGRLAKHVMDRVCRAGDGLFPAPDEIKLSCSCPDWADMCKHVAAVLYGVGARLDQSPELLFVLRGVDENELLGGAGQDLARSAAPASAKVLASDDMAALFGLDMAEEPAQEAPNSATPGRKRAEAPAAKKPASTAATRKKKSARKDRTKATPHRARKRGELPIRQRI